MPWVGDVAKHLDPSTRDALIKELFALLNVGYSQESTAEVCNALGDLMAELDEPKWKVSSLSIFDIFELIILRKIKNILKIF